VWSPVFSPACSSLGPPPSSVGWDPPPQSRERDPSLRARCRRPVPLPATSSGGVPWKSGGVVEGLVPTR
jgi:hypothetical protein